MRFLLSDESVNSYGYKVLTAGIRHANKLPCLLNHNLDGLPVGYFENFSKENRALYADLTLDANEKEIMSKVEGGFLDSVSIGFLINEIQYINGYEVVTDCELKEISLVSVPSNRNAKKLKVGDIQTLSIKMVKEESELARLQSLSETQKNMILDLQNTISKLKAEHENEVESLKAKLKELNEANLKSNAEALVEGALSANKILASQKEIYLKLALADFESTKALLASLEAYTPITKQLGVIGTQATERTFEDLHKNDPKALEEIKKNNPDHYKKLLAELKTKIGK